MHYHEGREEHEERRHNKPFEPLQCTTNDPVTASFQFQISFFVFFAPFVVASLRTTTIREVSRIPGMGSILLEHGSIECG